MRYSTRTIEVEAFRFGFGEIPDWVEHYLSTGRALNHHDIIVTVEEAPRGRVICANKGDFVVRYPDDTVKVFDEVKFHGAFE